VFEDPAEAAWHSILIKSISMQTIPLFNQATIVFTQISPFALKK